MIRNHALPLLFLRGWRQWAIDDDDRTFALGRA